MKLILQSVGWVERSEAQQFMIKICWVMSYRTRSANVPQPNLQTIIYFLYCSALVQRIRL